MRFGRFCEYRWPGNVRELRNVVEQLVWLSTAGVVGVEHLPVSMRSEPGLLAPLADRRRQRRRRPVRRARQAGRVVLGARLPDVPGSRHHAPRSARARSPRPAGVAGPLQVAADAVWHAEPRLSPLHELPGRARLRRRVPRVPWRSASRLAHESETPARRRRDHGCRRKNSPRGRIHAFNRTAAECPAAASSSAASSG